MRSPFSLNVYGGFMMPAELAVMDSAKASMPKMKRFLRLRQVIETTGVSRSAIYRKIAASDFPRPIHIGPNSVAWSEAEILRWMDERELSRDSEGAR